MDTIAGYKAKHSELLYTLSTEQEATDAAVQQQKTFGFDRPHGNKPHSKLTVGSNSDQKTEPTVPVISRQGVMQTNVAWKTCACNC